MFRSFDLGVFVCRALFLRGWKFSCVKTLASIMCLVSRINSIRHCQLGLFLVGYVSESFFCSFVAFLFNRTRAIRFE